MPPLNLHFSKSFPSFSFFFLTVLLTTSITSLFVLPWPILQALIKKLTNLSSSLDVKYGSGPDYEPCFTLLANLSFNVVLGTLYSSLALLMPILPFFTASIALVI